MADGPISRPDGDPGTDGGSSDRFTIEELCMLIAAIACDAEANCCAPGESLIFTGFFDDICGPGTYERCLVHEEYVNMFAVLDSGDVVLDQAHLDAYLGSLAAMPVTCREFPRFIGEGFTGTRGVGEPCSLSDYTWRACGPGLTCASDTCVTALPRGATCESGLDCGPNEAECSDLDDDGAYQCTALGAAGAPCWGAGDCAPSLGCTRVPGSPSMGECAVGATIGIDCLSF